MATDVLAIALFVIIVLILALGLHIMATLADLQAAVTRNTNATQNAVNAFATAVPDLQPAIDQLDANSAALEALVPPTP